MKVIFVAGRFRGKNDWIVAENVRAAERLGFEVAKLGAMPLIPHANTAHFDGTLTDEFWIKGTAELLRRCDAIILLPNWLESRGAKAEQALAIELNIPIFYELNQLKAWIKENG